MKSKTSVVNAKFIYFLMIITPFIDLLNGLFTFVFKIDISPGIIIRTGILVAIIIFYIKQEAGNFMKFIFIISLFLIQMLFIGFNSEVNILQEVLFISKIYYNMFLIFSIDYLFKNEVIVYDKCIEKMITVSIIVAASLIITKILGIGINSYGEAGGYKGLYIGTNDLTAVLIMTFPFIIYRLSTAHRKFKYIISSIIVGVNIIMIGTKTSVIVFAVIIVFYIYNIFLKEKDVKNIIFVGVLIFIFAMIFRKYLWEAYSSTILVRQKYFLSQQNLVTYLLSGRNFTLMNAMKYWGENIQNIILGLGFTNGSNIIGSFLTGHGMIEMDFFDILYFYGVGLFTVIAIPLTKRFFKAIVLVFKSKKLLFKTISLIYIIIFCTSFFGGHILLSPLSGIYFAIIYGMLKKEKI
ncbi:O-antigen ligase family protein [Clostridium septicum]|uniref:O-antigen ligase family protein n=1 Tax=Clostridium septicum TaxID=1504 RepID=UPI00272E550E|nr:O-antigen ligase family protein [Clostridium septicum]WLF68999.1 O-antigen ligase family protein [Clostridium septicum]